MPPEALVKLRNVSGYPLHIPMYRLDVGPGEVIDLAELGHDLETDGVITGFEVVQEPTKPKPAKSSDKENAK